VLTPKRSAILASYRRHTQLPSTTASMGSSPPNPHLTPQPSPALQRYGSVAARDRGDKPAKQAHSETTRSSTFISTIAELQTVEASSGWIRGQRPQRASRLCPPRRERRPVWRRPRLPPRLIQPCPTASTPVLTDNGMCQFTLVGQTSGTASTSSTRLRRARHRAPLTKCEPPVDARAVERMNRTSRRYRKRYHYDTTRAAAAPWTLP
jgi:hypothetical protein